VTEFHQDTPASKPAQFNVHRPSRPRSVGPNPMQLHRFRQEGAVSIDGADVVERLASPRPKHRRFALPVNRSALLDEIRGFWVRLRG
jgi:hypothetical protein